MRLAFFSYEYPPDTAFGGIATSTHNTARMMVERGHDVEVFTASPSRSGSFEEDGITVHRVVATGKREFVDAIVPSFSKRHLSQPFDLIEGPEHGADAEGVHFAFPDVPLVVKLRTPKAVIDEIGLSYVPWSSRVKYVIGRLMRGRRPNAYWRYDPDADRECLHARDAKLIISPSEAIRDRLVQMWKLDPRRIEVIPHPFAPSDELLAIEPETATNRVTYFGRLEARKGVLELMEAIPDVLKKVPDARFRFIGKSLPHPRTREDLRMYMERRLQAHLHAVEFIEAVPYSDLPSFLADTDICALPSVWESFGFTCLEAMAAARAVVVSSGTGMAEMVDDGRYGLVIPPQNAARLAEALVGLLRDPSRRIKFGKGARGRVLEHYNYGRIAALQESAYQRAVSQRSAASQSDTRLHRSVN